MKKQQKLTITIGHLYGDLMNIYGDNGNIVTIKKRCEWRGIGVEVRNIGLKEEIKPGEIDLYFFGGGQDQAQGIIAQDLVGKDKSEAIKKDVERGVPLLSICGGYQLLGEYYQPHEGSKLPGLGIFPAYTKASFERMIGNIVVKVSEFASQRISESVEGTRPHLLKSERPIRPELTVEGLRNQRPSPLPKEREPFQANSLVRQSADSLMLVGFENHSGKTYLKSGAIPLGTVITGFGNNGEDKTEGCVYKNAIGCYMHGSLLPKNPHLADWLIEKALEIKYGKGTPLEELNDDLELKAHDFAVSRFSS